MTVSPSKYERIGFSQECYGTKHTGARRQKTNGGRVRRGHKGVACDECPIPAECRCVCHTKGRGVAKRVTAGVWAINCFDCGQREVMELPDHGAARSAKLAQLGWENASYVPAVYRIVGGGRSRWRCPACAGWPDG